jgi:hypothetical protein
MPRGKKFTAEQIIGKLREAEVGLAQGKTVPEVVRKLSVTEQTYYQWKREYGNQSVLPGDGLLCKDYNGRSKASPQQCTDGLSKTIALAESAGRPFHFVRGRQTKGTGLTSDDARVNGGGWCRPASDYSFGGTTADGLTVGDGATVAINVSNGQLVSTAPFNAAPFGTEGTSNPYSFHPGVVNVVYGDGAVKSLSDSISIQIFAALVTRSGAESVTDD